MKFTVVLEKTKTGYSAYTPDFDGCVATGRTRSQVLKNIKEAIEFHMDGLRQEGLRMPRHHTEATLVEIPA